MKVVQDSFDRETFQLRAATVIEFLIQKWQRCEISAAASTLTGAHKIRVQIKGPTWTKIKPCVLDLLRFITSHLHRLVLQARRLFTERAGVWDVHWDAGKCLTADAPEFWCKDAAGITGADHLTVKKETDSSWKANERVSAIWGRGPKLGPFSATLTPLSSPQ